ncbi:MAG: heavy metal-associated domain-containing protein [Christensenellales bacterium]|nr:heavy metal-associated domain-containing protein [Christensenellales bacterium]
MKRVFRVVDLDCANCAARMEQAISKIPGVEAVSVSFLAQKITLVAEDTAFSEIITEMVKCVKRVNSDCEVILK